jgi:hypothetical protein
MSKLNHYRAALYLCGAIALIDAIWILRLGYFIPSILTVIIVIGLLLRSNLIRYFGGVFMAIWAAALLWQLISGGAAPLSRPNGAMIFFYFAFSAALNLLAAGILLLSKQFAYEFAKLRESAPKYIIYLRRLLIGATIAAMVFATFNDIVNLMNSR